ncbi:MAG: HRDC domain-containing protein [Pirellulales bacterium]
MPFKFFVVPVRDLEAAEVALNGFLRSHRVLAVYRRFVEQGSDSFWSFCIDYVELSRAGDGSSAVSSGKSKGKDYKQILNEADFAVFARLRDLRREISQAEAVPIYTVFTNEQLAQMVQNRVRTKSALTAIAGVGDARSEKYGPRFLELLDQLLEANVHETGGESV